MRTSILCAIAAALVFGAPAAAAFAQEYGAGDPLDNAYTYSSRYFECNGTYQKQYDVWWLATANPLSFRRHFTGTWYFEGVDLSRLAGSEFILRLDALVYTNSIESGGNLRLDALVYTNSIESGGKPTAAAVDLIITNPNSEEKYEVKSVRVEMNKDEIPIPTYVYVPREFITDAGRTVVELQGLGQIGVAPSGLSLLLPKDRF